MPASEDYSATKPLLTAIILSLGAAISLGMARFSYALLLPPMRADLGWTYFLAGSMNTGNAFGYFVGALLTPALMRRVGAQKTLFIGAILTALFMILCGFVIDANVLMLQRVLAGIASAFVFIAGGLLAARLGSMHLRRAGLLIGLYYGGTGFGIAMSALLVPLTIDVAIAHGSAHAWQWAWLALGVVCLLATLIMVRPVRDIDGTTAAADEHGRFKTRAFAPSLAAYFMFGVGYIGYMTFVVALLKDQGMSSTAITIFYTTLGLAVMASSRVWAAMLDHYKGGEAMAILTTLLCIATLLPVLSTAWPLAFASGILFGGVFLAVVASTTALVRHNAQPAAWSSGISMF
ncbi:MAG TPA: YbfB/YjiJ family MFS transporter, partial [Burkholderiaceae bacterium]|nr:YbfB/YjiJ family MFS transporter [Burkholderiaceae bacterium]